MIETIVILGALALASGVASVPTIRATVRKARDAADDRARARDAKKREDNRTAQADRAKAAAGDRAHQDEAARAQRDNVLADPRGYVVTSLLLYLTAVRSDMAARFSAARDEARRLTNRSNSLFDRLPAPLRHPGTTQYAVLIAVPSWVVINGVALYLDYKVFYGTDGNAILSACLSILTVVVTNVASFLIGFGLGWHAGLRGPEGESTWQSRFIACLGAVVAVICLIVMIGYAPHRSLGEQNTKVQTLEDTKTDLTSVMPESDRDTGEIAYVTAKLAAAEKERDLAESVDRASVGIITALEIPLAEGAIFGLLVVRYLAARRRRDEAVDAERAARVPLGRADDEALRQIGVHLRAAGVENPDAVIRDGLRDTTVMRSLMQGTLDQPVIADEVAEPFEPPHDAPPHDTAAPSADEAVPDEPATEPSEPTFVNPDEPTEPAGDTGPALDDQDENR